MRRSVIVTAPLAALLATSAALAPLGAQAAAGPVLPLTRAEAVERAVARG
ncbi:MAG: hypothetical protein HOQ26_08490, partial [Gemmatimonadaceae bacterium]|nr:hypothetical protein [Gemmatimonadaceae bacterium]